MKISSDDAVKRMEEVVVLHKAENIQSDNVILLNGGEQSEFTFNSLPEYSLNIEEGTKIKYGEETDFSFDSQEIEDFSSESIDGDVSINGIGYPHILNSQLYLQKLGFYSGSIDGNISSSMREALRNFQLVYGMGQTGSLT